MVDIANLDQNVKPQGKVVNGHNSDFVWGADAIGKVIGRNARQVHHLLNSGQLKCAKRLGGRWVASRAALLRELGAA